MKKTSVIIASAFLLGITWAASACTSKGISVEPESDTVLISGKARTEEAAPLSEVYFPEPDTVEARLGWYVLQESDTTGFLLKDPHADATTQEIRNLYSTTRNEIIRKRLELANAFQVAGTDSARNSVLARTRRYLRTALPEKLFPLWYGTEWDFNGYTSRPREGIVACGYFVSTPLKQAGVNVNRYELAKCYSHAIVKQLCDSGQVQELTPDGLPALIDHMKQMPEDLYVVGLDNHVGFLLKDEENVWFIHSNYGDPFGVTREPAHLSYALQSEVYILGNLTGSEGFLKSWLQEEEIEVVR